MVARRLSPQRDGQAASGTGQARPLRRRHDKPGRTGDPCGRPPNPRPAPRRDGQAACGTGQARPLRRGHDKPGRRGDPCGRPPNPRPAPQRDGQAASGTGQARPYVAATTSRAVGATLVVSPSAVSATRRTSSKRDGTSPSLTSRPRQAGPQGRTHVVARRICGRLRSATDKQQAGRDKPVPLRRGHDSRAVGATLVVARRLSPQRDGQAASGTGQARPLRRRHDKPGRRGDPCGRPSAVSATRRTSSKRDGTSPSPTSRPRQAGP